MQALKADEEVNYEFRTHFAGKEYSFNWIIDGYSKITQIQSPSFYPEGKCKWFAKIWRDDEHMISELTRSGGYGDVHVQLNYCVTNKYNKLWGVGSYAFKFDNLERYETVIKKLPLKTSDVKDANDILKLIMHLKLCILKTDYLNYSLQCDLPSEAEFQRDVQKFLSKDLEKLYKNSLNSDVSLSIKGEILHVHKAILSARSPVFAAMFQQEILEAKSNVVVIEDVKMATMKEVVAFMYGTVRRNYDYDTATEVYCAAGKYELKELKNICGVILACKLNEENAGDILRVSDRYHDTVLKTKAMEFISFRIKSCANTNWWIELMSSNDDLAKELKDFTGFS